MLFVLSLIPALKQQFNELINGKVKQIEIKNQTYYNQSQKFRIKLVKNRQKTLQRH